MNQDSSAATALDPHSSQLDSSSLRSAEQIQVDAHTIRAREAERAALRADIEAFLASGGKVTSVAPDLRTDQPRKPQNNYGKGSL